MEFQQANSTLPQMEFQRFQELAQKYSGFMIFRDGLRVLPYGRTDNDFFEIESRRSLNAGREFWNHRQMFGRLAISRDKNPNLKDKAGREGILDNRAAKTLRGIVSNILRQSARRYFGSASSLRKEMLPQVQESNRAKKASDERNKLRQKQRKEFRSKLQAFNKEIPNLNAELEMFAQKLVIRNEDDIANTQQALENFRDRILDYRLPGTPKSLGPLEDAYADYRHQIRTASALVETITGEIDEQIERVNPAKPRELLEKQIARNAAQIHRRIRQWKSAIAALQKGEFERIRTIIDERNKIFHAEATPLLARFDRSEVNYSDSSKILDRMKQDLDRENAEIFVPYIGALEALRESIDLEHIASFGMEELSDLRSELERLNSLAQLGIAVEIVGHELQAYDEIIGSGLRRLPDDVRRSKAAKDIEFGYDGLTDQLRFLSPLRLAGQRIQRWITGSEIAQYVRDFFKINLAKTKITLEVTAAFERIEIFDQQSRLYPVFLNLINNSIYWLEVSDQKDRKIILDRIGAEVVIADNGPGIDPEDLNNLFSLFFTKKVRGGRGVGLYLARANLAAGGHKIRYEPDTSSTPLPGANFFITFRGME
jgi:signal transduction histidine kinase